MYNTPINDELAIKLSANRILNFLSGSISVPDAVRDLLRKFPEFQEIGTLTNLLLVTADEYAQDSFSSVLAHNDLVTATAALQEWLYDQTNVEKYSSGLGYLAKRVPTNAIVWDAIVEAAKFGPSLPSADLRAIIDELIYLLPQNETLYYLKAAVKQNRSHIFAQRILADTSACHCVGYRVRHYETASLDSNVIADVLFIYPHQRGFGYEEYLALVDAARKQNKEKL